MTGPTRHMLRCQGHSQAYIQAVSTQGGKPKDPSLGLMDSGLAKGLEPLLPQPPRVISWLPQRATLA